jgi:hypothetical protein
VSNFPAFDAFALAADPLGGDAFMRDVENGSRAETSSAFAASRNAT